MTVGTVSDTWSVTTVGDPCAGSPAVGTTCADGTKFAGYTPDGWTKMYTTPGDGPHMMVHAWPWDNWYGADNPWSGVYNTGRLYSHYTNEAANYCGDLVAYGRSDWYLPAIYELDVMNANAAALGLLMYQGYWSSLEAGQGWAWFYWIGYGLYTEWKGAAMNIRCTSKD